MEESRPTTEHTYVIGTKYNLSYELCDFDRVKVSYEVLFVCDKVLLSTTE